MGGRGVQPPGVLAIALALGLCGLGSYLVATAWWGAPKPGNRITAVFEVRTEEGLETLSGALERADLVRSATAFRWFASWIAHGRPIRAGLYRLGPGMDARAVAEALLRPASERRLTIPEGYSVRQIAALADRLGICSEPDVERAASSPTPYLGRFAWLSVFPAGASLEGFLFPDTYYVPSGGLPAQRLVAMMLSRFGAVAWPEIRDHAGALSPYQSVTLASIVEREAKRRAERSIIAGVFLARLRLGMPLGSDPTVEYALGRHEAPNHPLTLADTRVDSPYNTYRYRGLPPGPIANPGLASIEAALRPDATSYLYFVARGDGSHQFSRTFAGQLAAQRRYQR